MRFLLAASAALCLMAPVAFLAACGSSDNASTTDQNLAADASTEDEDDGEGEGEEASDPAPADEGAGGAVEDATAPVSDTDAGTRCTPESIRESESNNDIASATVIPSTSSSICGRLLKGDPDFIKFVMPDSIGGWGIENLPAVDIQLFIDGKETAFNRSIPFVPGGEYTLKLSANRMVDYNISFFFE